MLGTVLDVGETLVNKTESLPRGPVTAPPNTRYNETIMYSRILHGGVHKRFAGGERKFLKRGNDHDG